MQVFSREICEIFKNTLFYETPSVAASMKNWNSQILSVLSKKS